MDGMDAMAIPVAIVSILAPFVVSVIYGLVDWWTMRPRGRRPEGEEEEK